MVPLRRLLDLHVPERALRLKSSRPLYCLKKPSSGEPMNPGSGGHRAGSNVGSWHSTS